MKKQVTHIIAFAAITGLTLTAWGGAILDQSEFPQILAQPIDQDVPVGGSTVLSVEATNADGFLWLRNGTVIEGQTNSSLALENVGINDVGLYHCYLIKGTEAVPTRAATLNVFAATSGDTITVFGTPVLGGGSQGTCPGPYTGYVNYRKTVSQGWGWGPSTNTTIHTATDGAGRTDTKVEYGGKNGDKGCDQTTVMIPDPTLSPKYRFSIYFTNNVPTNAYPITLSGFDP